MKRKSILFLYLLLLAIGLAYETQSLTEGWMSGSQYGIVGLSTLILLVYALPAVWALFTLLRSGSCLGYRSSLFSARRGFVAGWLSSFANTYFHDMIQAIAPNSDFWNQYESAIAAPLFEEPFKLIPIFFVPLFVQCSSHQVDLPLGDCLWSWFPDRGGFCLYPSGSAGRFLLHGVRDSRSCG